MSTSAPRLFLGRPRFLGGVASVSWGFSTLLIRPSSVFRRTDFFGAGVPTLFTGVPKDFRGLPRRFLGWAGEESSDPFSGTVVVIVRPVGPLLGDFDGLRARLLGIFDGLGLFCTSSSFSASTVTRILHGLMRSSVWATDLVGDDVRSTPAEGVVK